MYETTLRQTASYLCDKYTAVYVKDGIFGYLCSRDSKYFSSRVPVSRFDNSLQNVRNRDPHFSRNYDDKLVCT